MSGVASSRLTAGYCRHNLVAAVDDVNVADGSVTVAVFLVPSVAVYYAEFAYRLGAVVVDWNQQFGWCLPVEIIGAECNLLKFLV